jgi:hypothetical protein
MIEIQALEIDGQISYEVKNTETGKKSFVPHDQNQPESLWNEVHLAVNAYHKKKHYKAMCKIAKMELASNLPDTTIVVPHDTIQISQQHSADQPQQP